MGRVVVVGLGPAGPDLLTGAGRAAIERVAVRFLRTARHPAGVAVPGAEAFDDVYEQAATFDEVYATIVERLVAAAGAADGGEVLYAVPGSPLVAEETVARLRADGRVEVEVVPGLSFLDLAWARLGVDPVEAGVRVVDGRRFAVEAAGARGPLLVAQCDSRPVLSDVKLAVDEPGPGGRVVVLQRLGLPDEAVFEVGWAALDRSFEPDHLTSLYVPVLAVPVAAELVRFEELVRTLRQKCPWDREQTHQTLTRHLVEESYEVLEAVEALDRDPVEGFAHLAEELGDLLLQVFLHSTIAAEEGQFTLADVTRRIHDKLVHRHPHVFGEVQVSGPGEVMRNWERLKQEEKGDASLMGEVPGHLPALLYAHKVQRKAAAVGFDWAAAADVYPKVSEELDELRAEPSADELGDLLFAVVNLGRHLKLDPEAALRGATAKFRDRFMAMERLAAARGTDLHALDLPALDALWTEVKG